MTRVSAIVGTGEAGLIRQPEARLQAPGGTRFPNASPELGPPVSQLNLSFPCRDHSDVSTRVVQRPSVKNTAGWAGPKAGMDGSGVKGRTPPERLDCRPFRLFRGSEAFVKSGHNHQPPLQPFRVESRLATCAPTPQGPRLRESIRCVADTNIQSCRR